MIKTLTKSLKRTLEPLLYQTSGNELFIVMQHAAHKKPECYDYMIM